MPANDFSSPISVPDHPRKQDFLKAASKLWEAKHPGASDPGGRPSLKGIVWAECDKQWEKWGKHFPADQSTAKDLVNAIEERVPGNRDDLRTIRRHVDQWILFHLDISEWPESWLKTPFGKILMRQHFAFDVYHDLLKHDELSIDGKLVDPALRSEFARRQKELATVPDKVLRKQIQSRKM